MITMLFVCRQTYRQGIQWLRHQIKLPIFRAISYGLLLSIVQPIYAQEVNNPQAQLMQLHAQLNELKTKLDSDLQTAVQNKAENVADLQQWQKLTDQFIFSQAIYTETTAKIAQTMDEASLPSLTANYTKMLDDFHLLGKTVEADKRAATTRTDSKMYFDMRVRAKIPPKTLKAYGIMELAKQERDKGNFTEALKLWDQAEIMVKESFNEHIAEMAKWREDALRNAEADRQKLKIKVETLLANYFVDIPAGSFTMGGKNGDMDESPERTVTIPAFKLGKTEVTFALYDLCVESTSCFSVPKDEGWGRGEKPVINVGYHDLYSQFLPWLNKITGKTYRLPSEAEWEYAARAGTTSEYSWGDNVNCAQARFDGGETSVCNARDPKNTGPAKVQSYQPNAFGLYDMYGNVWEWIEDCWTPNYQGAPTDGSAWMNGNCNIRVLRGGAWDYPENAMRSGNRFYFNHKIRKPNFGFRLAQSLTSP
jgi:formylglycine-generating enzyme required for sulfatase activity